MIKNDCAYQLICTALKVKRNMQNFLSVISYALKNNDYGIYLAISLDTSIVIEFIFICIDLCRITLDFLTTAMLVSLSENNEYNEFTYLLDTSVVEAQPFNRDSSQQKGNRKSRRSDPNSASQQIFVILAELFDTIKGN